MTRKVVALAIVVLVAVVGLFAATRSPGTLEQAQVRKAAKRAIDERHWSYGMLCDDIIDSCDSLIARAKKNPKLAEALHRAVAADVTIWPMPLPWFSVGVVGNSGSVHIFTLYSDEKIIAFLTN